MPFNAIGYSRKNPVINRKRYDWGEGGGGLRICVFENFPGFFWFFILPLEFLDKTKLHPSKILKPKTKTSLETPHDFVLITSRLSMLFLINPWKLHLLFLQYHWKFHTLNPPPLIDFFLE